VADFLVMGLAFHRFAMANPQQYQPMSGTSSMRSSGWATTATA
jgi:hypothetical protein